jgi:glyoxylase-like metal-dependent hydrolase (beta-lactamase superfamily II)
MTGSGNWTYFFPGRAPVLIDAGVGQAEHLEAIAVAAPGGPARVLVTHAHGDHISGVTAMADRWPATQYAKWPWPERDATFAVDWQPLGDEQVIVAGDGELQVIHTPGHAPDHIAFWDASSRTLFCGDLVVPGTTVVILASHGGSLSAYLASLERVLALRPTRLMPAHGAAIDDPESLIRHYIAHRMARERQVIEGLRAGDRTVGALVARIYVGLDSALIPMARESVLAHLGKLQDDAVARQDGDEWALY